MVNSDLELLNTLKTQLFDALDQITTLTAENTINSAPDDNYLSLLQIKSQLEVQINLTKEAIQIKDQLKNKVNIDNTPQHSEVYQRKLKKKLRLVLNNKLRKHKYFIF